MVEFTEWLDRELLRRDWTRADLAQRAKISQSALSLIYSQNRKPGADVCNGIAVALKIPSEEVFRAAGLLPKNNQVDADAERAAHLIQTLKKPANKRRALDYLELLLRQEETDGYDDTPNTATEPRQA